MLINNKECPNPILIIKAPTVSTSIVEFGPRNTILIMFLGTYFHARSILGPFWLPSKSYTQAVKPEWLNNNYIE